jgi:hypothetical protein
MALLFGGVGALPAARAATETSRIDYAAYGKFENRSQVDDNAGCRRNEDWVGQYSFRQDWKFTVDVRPHGISVHKNADYVGAPGLPAHPTSIEVTGTQTAQPQQQCEWSGGSDDTGRYQCGDAHPKLLFDKVMRIGLVAASKQLLFTAPAFFDYNPALIGSNSIRSLRATGCSSIAFSPGRYLVGPDIAARIPIKASTIYHLRRGHYFFVHTRLGHYTVRPDQTGHSCFTVTRGANDFCRVTSDEYVGELAVKRVS